MDSAVFENAPPPTVVDGRLIVPIHILDSGADVSFDGASAGAVVDAALTYVVGPTGGYPFFDLRQTVGKCWIDGVLLDPDVLVARNVGASGQSVRVIDTFQRARSIHRLRVVYKLRTPSADLRGAYPPVLLWSAGPRLRWSFGMSDLYGGRYLEAWFPSNLPFDHFPFTLGVRIHRTPIEHVVITNGDIEIAGFNQWTVRFPEWFTTMSPLVEMHAVDTVQVRVAQAILPRSSREIAVQAWKFVGGPDDLSSSLARLASSLCDYETRYGEFIGDRFVCLLHGAEGGMEYACATTTSAEAIGHELFHSWFARGVAPASQADGWWDEAFTRFHDNADRVYVSLDSRAPPTELCSRDPFQRATPVTSYDVGSRVFRGIAALMGADRLRAAMRELYEAQRRNSVSTPALESHLIAKSGVAEIVDVFHRFVYGFGDPTPEPRLRVERVWVRINDDDGEVHQRPKPGRGNWIHVRVHNAADAGSCDHFVVVLAVRPRSAAPFVYPTDLFPCVAAVSGFDLEPGRTRTLSAQWHGRDIPFDPRGSSLLAAVHARRCHPTPGICVYAQLTTAQRDLPADARL
ncbi:hypothetical protein [Nocardia sp. NPDC060259]|uniref:hypothetical protein n=1 Tax=Nocardia sp. NPDC060259 TaxID=3347088 RepID=UPI003649E512